MAQFAGWADRGAVGRPIYDVRVPIYEFECERCGLRFEDLVRAGTEGIACPSCGSERTLRRYSPAAPPGRLPRGPRVRASESRRGEREAARRERLEATKTKRAGGAGPTKGPEVKPR